MQTYKVYKYRWVILAIYMYVAALTQLYWLNFAGIDTYIEEHLNISAMSTGWLALVIPLGQVFLSIPTGIVIDKKGFKYGSGIGVLIIGLFAMFRLINPGSYAVLLISQIGICLGVPFILNGITKLAVTWFPQKEEATAVGFCSLALFIGMMIGLGATPSLVQTVGFESMLLIYGIAGIVGMLLFFLLVRPEPPTPVREIGEVVIISNWEGIRTILRIRSFVILGFIALIGIGVFNGLVTWLQKMLGELHHISMIDAGNISAILIFGGILGCIIIPVISDKIMKRKPFLILEALVGAACITILIFASSYTLNMANAFVLGFFFMPVYPIMLTMSAEITGARFAGISAAYLNLLGNVGALVIVPTMESLHGATGQFILPLALLAILLCISFTLSIVIKEPIKNLG